MGKTTRRVSETTPGPSRKRVAANATEGENTNNKREAQKHPCRLASKKGPQKGRANSSPTSSRRIPKTHGAQNGTPRKPPRSRTHGQKGEQTSAVGQKKRTRTSKTSACGSVLLLPELCLSQKKRRRRKNLRTRNKPKNTRPDIKRIFPNAFGSELPKHKTKT